MKPYRPTSILGQLRTMAKGKRVMQPLAPPSPLNFNVNDLRSAVSKDTGITSSQKESVLQLLGDPDFMMELKSGALGAALMYLITRYLKLKPTAQVLLSLGGFGIGKILYEYKHDPKSFATYNDKIKMYEIR